MYDQILSRVYNSPHLITREKLEEIRLLVTMRARGVHLDAEMFRLAREAADARRMTGTAQRNIAVLPVLGTLAKRMDLLSESSGGTSTDRLGQEFDRLVADESISAIVLDVDSPGGEAYGVQELSDRIYAARGRKPIVAVANPEAASAAYYIASAADSISVTPSGMVGSVGVVAVHTDLSQLNEAMGVKITYISAGDYKTEGNPDQPLADESLAYYQEQVNGIYQQFVADVARNRGIKPADVRANYGQGRMLRAADAKRAGMADRVETLEAAIERLAARDRRRESAKLEREMLKLR